MADQRSRAKEWPGDAALSAVYWQGGDPRWQTSDMVPLTTTERADVCIVGGGFTGLWTALSIKRLAPGTDVVLVEREYCGAGASGRNGGWVNGWDDMLPTLISRFGRDAALWLMDASRARLARVPELRRTVFIIPSHVVATASSADALDRLGWVAGRPFADGRTAVHYAQRTADDRVVFGRGGGRLGYGRRVIPAHYHDARESESIVADMHGMLPATRDLEVQWRRGGPLERTQHGIPWVGALGKYRNLHYGLGYSGNGVAASNLIGRTLAALALGLKDDYAQSPLVSEPPTYLPPEPIRSAGARAVRSAIERCEVMEDEGRRPDTVSRALRRCLTVSMPKGVTLWRRDEMD